MVIRQIFAMLLGLGLVLSASAQQARLRDGHPDEYVVQQGDTLWGIAERFLTNPWDWPAIWQANPQIENPHLIYPGDVVSLIYVNGEPRLALNHQGGGNGGEGRLSPRIRDVTGLEPVPTVPLSAIEDFLLYPRVISEEQFENLAYVLANNARNLHALTGDRVYARGVTQPAGTELVVMQMNYRFRDADSDEPDQHDFRATRGDDFYFSRRPEHRDPYGWQIIPRLFGGGWPVVGYEMWEVARVKVLKAGDPAILEVTESRREVTVGDYIMPIDNHIYEAHFTPHAMENVPENARILALSDTRYHVGHYGVVAINLGKDDGVETGHVFSVFHPSAKVHDLKAHPYSKVNPFRSKVELPQEYAGKIMVFRTFDRVSYGLMMEGKNSILDGDVLRHADEEL